MNESKKQFNKLKLLQDAGAYDYDDINDLKINQNLLIDAAYEFIKDSNYEEALKLFCMGLSSDNTDPDMLNGLGITLCELERMKDAEIIFLRAVRYNPDDGITYANLAGVYWELFEFDKAVYYYSKSLELDPDLDDAYFNLINLYLEIDSIFMAYITCLRLVERFPEDEEAKELLEDVILNLGIMFF